MMSVYDDMLYKHMQTISQIFSLTSFQFPDILQHISLLRLTVKFYSIKKNPEPSTKDCQASI